MPKNLFERLQFFFSFQTPSPVGLQLCLGPVAATLPTFLYPPSSFSPPPCLSPHLRLPQFPSGNGGATLFLRVVNKALSPSVLLIVQGITPLIWGFWAMILDSSLKLSQSWQISSHQFVASIRISLRSKTTICCHLYKGLGVSLTWCLNPLIFFVYAWIRAFRCLLCATGMGKVSLDLQVWLPFTGVETKMALSLAFCEAVLWIFCSPVVSTNYVVEEAAGESPSRVFRYFCVVTFGSSVWVLTFGLRHILCIFFVWVQIRIFTHTLNA